MQMSPLRGSQNQFAEALYANETASPDVQPIASSTQQQPGSTPQWLIPPRPATTELLSDWQASSMQHPHIAAIPLPVAVPEQETVKQEAVSALISIPGLNHNGVSFQSSLPAFPYRQISPDSSSINPQGAMFTTPQPPAMIPASGVQMLPPHPDSPSPGTVNNTNFQAPNYPMPAQSGTTIAQAAYPTYQAAPPAFMPPLPAGSSWQPSQDKKRNKKRRVPIWTRVVLVVLLLLLIAGGSAAGYYYMNFSAPVNNIVDQQVPRIKGEDNPNQGRNSSDILSGGRINVLLLGSDTDEKFTNPDGTHTYLAQSDIVVTIDPATKSVGMLSIPRDFWINVPGYGMHKLDEAYALGGVALSRLTIEQDFGIPINYYAWVGLDGFVKVIDTAGGVDVDVIHPITDDNYPDDVGNKTGDIYALERLYLPPGPQHLDGPTALEYVRSRHADLVGDFGRSARQQQVLDQLKIKLNNPDIIGKLPELAQDLNGFVKTDMQLSDVFKLMYFARGLDSNKINRVILDPPYSNIGNVGTESVVFPHCDKIVPEIAQMFALGNKAICNIQANTGNSSLASASQTASLNPASQMMPGNLWQTTSQVASMSPMSLSGNTSDLFGIHSLLDLLFLVVFDSPKALQV